MSSQIRAEMDIFLLYLCLFVPIYADKCPSGTQWMQLQDGTWDCLVCSDCPRGQIKVANCSEDHDTQCEPCDDHSYYDDKELDCRPCSGCPPGEFIEKNCSQFMNSKCEQCPNRTFSSEANSSRCADCNVCSLGYYNVCNSTQNAVCMQKDEEEGSGYVGVIIAVILVILVASVIGLVLYLYRQRRFCWSRHGKDRSASYRHSPKDDKDLGGIHNRVPFRRWISCCRRVSGDEIKEHTEEKNQLTNTSDDKHAIESNESIEDPITKLKEAQMERENNFKKMTFKEQLEMLSSSVGVLVCSKPTLVTSPEGGHIQEKTTHELPVVFVGTKYIMTAYFALMDIFGTTGNGASNHSGFDCHDIYVTFNRSNGFSYSQFKILDSVPLYKNDSLDIVILEIEPYSERTSNNQKNNIWPPSLCLHASLPLIDLSTEIHFIIYDNHEKKNSLQLSNYILKTQKHQTSHEMVPPSYLTKAQVFLERSDYLVNRLREKNIVKNSLNDLKKNGISKIFWCRKNTTNPGAPGFIVDDGCCRLYCICTGKFLRFVDDLSVTEQKKIEYLSGLYIGTLMSAVYRDLKNVNPSLADELFFKNDVVSNRTDRAKGAEIKSEMKCETDV